MFREQKVRKLYWALTDSPIDPPQGICEDWVRRDERHRRMHLATGPQVPGAQLARLSYHTLKRHSPGVLLQIELHTGRKHQIRLQLAARGCPIRGDRKYGSRTPFPAGIALHARSLELEHPVRRIPLRLEAPPPPAWKGLES